MIEPPRGRAGALMVGAILLALLALPGAGRAGCIDLNAASLDELARLQHIGEGRAAAIVEGRPWADIRDLTRVHGLGAGRVLDIEAQGLACVEGVVAAAERPRIVGRARVLDGDTVEVAGERIRLIGIDAPEEGQHCAAAGRAWPCGDEATAYLAGLAGGREVACEVYGRDRWQRALAVCWLGNLDLNGEMVRQGWALPWYPSSGAVLGPDYDGLQAQARQAHAGMWRGEFVEPWLWRQGER